MFRMAKELFSSALGTVTQETLFEALKLMLYGMIGIFIVMALIFVVILVLNRVSGRKKEDKKPR